MSETLQSLGTFLSPPAEADDPEFQWEIQRASHRGLRVVAAVQMAFPLALLLFHAFASVGRAGEGYGVQSVPLILVGLATLIASFADWSNWNGRALTAISAWLTTTWLVATQLYLTGQGLPADYAIPGNITLVLLVAVAAVPFRPLHTMGLGLAIESAYLTCLNAPLPWSIAPVVGRDWFQHLAILMTVCLCSILSGMLYRQRASDFRSHNEALKALDYVRRAQSHALLAENAASLGRLAAAISHEFNSPLGSLKSAAGTLQDIASRQATATPEQRERMLRLQGQLYKTLHDSVTRLQEIVARMQRYTNLDRAEIQAVDVNVLIGDVANLLDAQARQKVRVETSPEPLPKVTCRPQQLSAALSKLLTNAVEAAEESGCVVVSTRSTGSRVEIEIRDTGKGLSRDELSTIFDPGFKVAAGRMGTGNWSLFSTRQIIYEHGGDINIHSVIGQGTVVWVNLPGQAQ